MLSEEAFKAQERISRQPTLRWDGTEYSGDTPWDFSLVKAALYLILGGAWFIFCFIGLQLLLNNYLSS